MAKERLERKVHHSGSRIPGTIHGLSKRGHKKDRSDLLQQHIDIVKKSKKRWISTV